MERATVLVVDDSPDNLALMGAILEGEFRVQVATNGDRALKLARGNPAPDLILLDVVMEGLDGYEVCRRLKADPDTAHIPILFLTSRHETADEQRGLDLGAVDYLSKPVNPPVVLARVRTHLKLKAAADFLRDENEFLEGEIFRRTAEVRALQEVTILALASLAETRDSDTGNHLWRTQLTVKELALALRDRPRFRPSLSDSDIALVVKSAPLHDIGKVGIPDSILMKPGRLDPEEFQIMKSHAQLGWEAIDHAERSLGTSVDFLRHAKDITLSHHEKWDGSGYPRGLAGDAIPVSGRLMAVADVYDALISRRVYKEPMGHDEAVNLLKEGRGTHFDPEVIDAFLEVEDRVREIALRYADAS